MQSKETLYNKYRPAAFADVVNQNHIKITLQNEIASNKLAHAYLFTGPRGIGKTTIARILAKSVNCTDRKDGEFEPCNKCDPCMQVDAGKSLSMVEIDAASQTKVDQTRENIIAASRISASAGHTKVFIIDEVHMLSTASFNALLKTLEEPPAKVLFILATTEIHKVPETIISRCQRFDFYKLSVKDLTDWMDNICQLEKREVSSDVLQAIAKQADGGARDALSVLGQVLTLSDKKITFDQASLVLPRSDVKIIAELTEFLINRQSGEAINLFNKSLMEGVDLNQIVVDWIDYLRQLLLCKLSADKKLMDSGFDKSVQTKMIEQADTLEIEKVIFMIDILLDKHQQIKFSSIPHLPVELAIVMICQHEKNEKGHNKDNDHDKSTPTSISTSTPVSSPTPTTTSAPNKIVVQDKPQIEPVVKEEVKSKSPPTEKSNLTLDDIQSKWLEILIALKEYNHSLSAIMKVARPISFTNRVFKVGFQYSFHMEVLQDKNKKIAMEEIISKELGELIYVEGVVDDDYEKRTVWEIHTVEEEDAIEPDSIPNIEAEKVAEADAKVDVATAFG
jgi:DNA polymerase III subunit gamma/tau